MRSMWAAVRGNPIMPAQGEVLWGNLATIAFALLIGFCVAVVVFRRLRRQPEI